MARSKSKVKAPSPPKMVRAQAKPLKELATIIPGYSALPAERRTAGRYLLIGGRNLKDERLITTDKDSYADDIAKNSFYRAVARAGDIIVSTLFNARKLHIYRREDPRAVVNNSCAIIRAPEQNDYIASYLRTLEGKERFLSDASHATGGKFIPRLSIEALGAIQIPLLPLTKLQRLGDAHIKSAANEDLVSLRNQFATQDSEIAQLRKQLKSLDGKDQEIETLRLELTNITSYYEDRFRKIEAQISTNDLQSRIAHGETSKMEFKSSIRWNLKANRDDPEMGLTILKTIAAFCNTDGGELLIGISDDRKILGIDHDHFENSDKFLLHFRNLITGKLSRSVIQCVTYEIVHIDGKQICHVVCKPSKQEIWVKPDSTRELFFVRTGHPRPSCDQVKQHGTSEIISMRDKYANR